MYLVFTHLILIVCTVFQIQMAQAEDYELGTETLYRCVTARNQHYKEWTKTWDLNHLNSVAPWDVCDYYSTQPSRSNSDNNPNTPVVSFCVCIEWEKVEVVTKTAVDAFIAEHKRQLESQSSIIEKLSKAIKALESRKPL